MSDDKLIKTELQYFIDKIVEIIRKLASEIVTDESYDRLIRYEVSARALQFFPMTDDSVRAIRVRRFESDCRGSIGITYWTKQFNLNNSSANTTQLILSLMACSHNTVDYPYMRLKCRNLVASYPSIMEDLEAKQWEEAMNWDLTH